MILKNSVTSGSRAGLVQLAVAAVLFAISPFTSEWRLLATLEVAVYFTLAGGALVVHGSVRRELPLKNLATTWLPINPRILAFFLVLFGSGALIAEDGQSTVGIVLMAVGYVSLGVISMLRLFGVTGSRPDSADRADSGSSD